MVLSQKFYYVIKINALPELFELFRVSSSNFMYLCRINFHIFYRTYTVGLYIYTSVPVYFNKSRAKNKLSTVVKSTACKKNIGAKLKIEVFPWALSFSSSVFFFLWASVENYEAGGIVNTLKYGYWGYKFNFVLLKFRM